MNKIEKRRKQQRELYRKNPRSDRYDKDTRREYNKNYYKGNRITMPNYRNYIGRFGWFIDSTNNITHEVVCKHVIITPTETIIRTVDGFEINFDSIVWERE